MVEERHELDNPWRCRDNRCEEKASKSRDESHEFVVDCRF